MSQFYDQASLVMIPSGYKNGKVYSQKPLSADGELTFTRASNATRVNADGLIEKVRTNLLLQSNTFSTGWSLANTTIASGQADRNGSNNAWLLTKSAGGGYIRQTSLASTAFSTFSVYLKAADSDYVLLLCGSGQSAYFDLVNGTVVSGSTASIESAGNGFYRCSIRNNTTATDARIYPAENGSTSASTGSIVIMDAQFEQTDFGPTPYIPTTTAAVSVGPVSGLPRLDYSGGCPSLLLEPQRTNLNPYSEQFNNADWEKTYSTITANQAVSPDGYTNADAWFETSDNNWHRLYDNGISVTAGTAYTCSLFVKANGRDWVSIQFFAGNGAFNGNHVWFNISNGTIGTTQTGITANIEDYGNGWYRIQATQTAASSTTGYILYLLANADGAVTYTGDPTKGAFVYGGMTEAGAYATSYIPTLSTAVTRVGESAYKTGISSLIGQTEGTLFIDIEPQDISGLGRYFGIESASGPASGWIAIISQGATPNTFRFYGNSFDFTGGPALRGVRAKVALAYKNGVQTSAYVNGVSVGTLTENTTGASFATTKLGYGPFGNDGSCNFHQALIFPTALSNAQLAELTTL